MAATISEVYVATKLAELAKRCGLKASHIDGTVHFVDMDTDPKGVGYFRLDFVSEACPPEEQHKADRFHELLGVKGTSSIKVDEIEDLEDLVDRALSLAPRGRSL